MAAMPILKIGNPTLRLASKPVSVNEDGLRELIKNMADTMYDAPGVGLAAVQIGVLKQVAVYDIGDGLNIMLNPKIISCEGEIEDEEGCLSIPEIRLPIVRHAKVEVRHMDLKGRTVEIEVDELLARAMQHEVDHMNGRLILDRATKEERKKALKQLNELTGIS